MVSITNDSYLPNVWRCPIQAERSFTQDTLVSSLLSGSRFFWGAGNKGWITPAAKLTSMIFALCLFALWSSSQPGNAIDTAAPLSPAISVQNPSPSPDAGKMAVSLSNGTEIKSRLRLEGRGELTIKNGTSFDAIVNVVEPRSNWVVRSFYVQAGKNFVEKNIAPGVYEIYFSTGKDWDSKTRSFHDDALYGRFERSIEFYEREDPFTGEVEFRGYEVTLQAVDGGGMACLPVDKQTFQQMMMDQPTESASAKVESIAPKAADTRLRR
jgi:hypothetical protein